LSRRRSGTPVVQRRHEVDERACLQALTLLLKRASRPERERYGMKAIQLCLFGPEWEEEITFDPEKRLVSEERLKNKVDGSKRLQEAQDVAEQLMLPIEDEKVMEEAWPG
jgi:hypothetical protein